MKNQTACIENFYISNIFKILFLIICGYTIILHISPVSIDYNIHMLSYFTVLSNIFCFITIFIITFKDIKNKIRSGKSETDYHPALMYTKRYSFFKGTSLMGIILTFFIYHFMVAKYKYPLLYNNMLCLPRKDFLAHYLVPLLYVLDWLLFQPKNINTLKSPLYWILYPLIYLCTIMIRSFCLPQESILYLTKYPYFFLNVQELGFTVFIIFMILILTAILIIGYSIIGIEKLMCFIAYKQSNNKQKHC